MLRRVLMISIACLLFSAPLLAEDWPCFHRSPDRSANSTETLVPPLVKSWEFQTNAEIPGSPAVVGGMVYSGSMDGTVYALDAATGARKWEYVTGGWVGASPSVSNGVVFIDSSDGYMYALDAQSGSLKWKYFSGGSDVSSPVVSDGLVIWGSGFPNKSVIAVREDNGAFVWKVDTGQMIYSSPAVSGNRVVIGSDDAYYRCYDKTTGQMLWQYLTTGGIYHSSPAISGNTVVFAPGDWDRRVYALDLTTGARKWTFLVPQTYWQSNSYVSTAAISGNAAYVVGGSPTQKVFALDLATGNLLWSSYIGETSPDGYASSPAVCGNLIYVASANGKVYALDKATGAEVWSYAVGTEILSSVAISNGSLYVGTEDGKLVCLTLQSFTSPTNLVHVGWNLVSVPGYPVNPDPAVVFSPVDIANSSFQFWRNDVDGGGYINYGPNDNWYGPVQPGIPYWFREEISPRTIGFKGYPITTDQQIMIPAHTQAPYWAMLGHPFEHSTPCSQICFSTPSYPTPLNWEGAYNASLVESNAQGFEGSAYISVGPSAYMVERTAFQPWHGYWLLVRTPEPLTIHLPVAPTAP